MKIKAEQKIICSYCFRENAAKEWNDLSYSKCTNREMKRAFTKLDDTKALLPKADAYYMCPSCNKWNKSDTMRIVNDNN